MFKKATIIITALLTVGCADAARSRLGAYGEEAHVECYSGGLLIYKGKSTGKVASQSSSDGYLFRDASDDVLREVSGNCVISYGAPASAALPQPD